MTQMQYYKKILKEMDSYINWCDPRALKSMLYFLKEANNNSSGIDKEIVDILENKIASFRNNCDCYKRIDEPEVYSTKRLTRNYVV